MTRTVSIEAALRSEEYRELEEKDEPKEISPNASRNDGWYGKSQGTN